MGNYRCSICKDTGKPYKKFEDVEFMDINYHFSRHHPVVWKQMMQNIEIRIGTDWCKPNSVNVDDMKKQGQQIIVKEKETDSAVPETMSEKHNLPPAKP